VLYYRDESQLGLLCKMSMSHMTSLQHHLQMLKPFRHPCKHNCIPKKKKKKKPKAVNQSIVWLHYIKVKPIDKENPKATCNYYNRISGCHWKNDTSALMTHITFNCPTSPLRKSEKSNVSKGRNFVATIF
jgi:hypothetical protein